MLPHIRKKVDLGLSNELILINVSIFTQALHVIQSLLTVGEAHDSYYKWKKKYAVKLNFVIIIKK